MVDEVHRPSGRILPLKLGLDSRLRLILPRLMYTECSREAETFIVWLMELLKAEEAANGFLRPGCALRTGN